MTCPHWPNVTVVSHPVVQERLTLARDKQTGFKEFRQLIGQISRLMAFELTRDTPTRPKLVETPMGPCQGVVLARPLTLVPVLRAGLGMVDPILNLIPSAEVWHLGLYRDEATAQPVEYYSKLPESDPVDVALVVDPMLATGGSASAALAALERWGASKVKLLSVIAAPEGVQAVQSQFPETQIYVCAIDERLNDQKFIVPGLGDAGDRTFNTLPGE